MAEPADLILRNGDVVTLDPSLPRATTIAIRGGVIVDVGSDDLTATWRGPATKVIDLRGQCAIPGFNDTHAHMEREGLKEQRLSLAGARSVGDILARIRAAAREAAPGSWIVTMPVGDPPYYFDALGQIAEGRMPTREELDAAAPDHPVYIPGSGGR